MPIGDYVVRFTGDTDDLSRAAQQARGEIEDVSKAASDLGDSAEESGSRTEAVLTKLRAAWVGIAAAIGSAAVAGKQFADLEDRIANRALSTTARAARTGATIAEQGVLDDLSRLVSFGDEEALSEAVVTLRERYIAGSVTEEATRGLGITGRSEAIIRNAPVGDVLGELSRLLQNTDRRQANALLRDLGLGDVEANALSSYAAFGYDFESEYARQASEGSLITADIAARELARFEQRQRATISGRALEESAAGFEIPGGNPFESAAAFVRAGQLLFSGDIGGALHEIAPSRESVIAEQQRRATLPAQLEQPAALRSATQTTINRGWRAGQIELGREPIGY